MARQGAQRWPCSPARESPGLCADGQLGGFARASKTTTRWLDVSRLRIPEAHSGASATRFSSRDRQSVAERCWAVPLVRLSLVLHVADLDKRFSTGFSTCPALVGPVENLIRPDQRAARRWLGTEFLDLGTRADTSAPRVVSGNSAKDPLPVSDVHRKGMALTVGSEREPLGNGRCTCWTWPHGRKSGSASWTTSI